MMTALASMATPREVSRRHRNRPKRPIGETHLGENRLVIGLGQEAGERRKPTVQKKFQVAKLTIRQVPGWPLARALTKFARIRNFQAP